ncbi:uncharacterized protein LOC144007805 isoform X2 [Festucalex cinctus]
MAATGVAFSQDCGGTGSAEQDQEELDQVLYGRRVKWVKKKTKSGHEHKCQSNESSFGIWPKRHMLLVFFGRRPEGSELTDSRHRRLHEHFRQRRPRH